MKDLKQGDKGRFLFILRKKGKKTPPFNLCATVIETDGKYVLLRDNDDLEYLPLISDIHKFLREKPKTDEPKDQSPELAIASRQQEVPQS